MNKQEMIIAYDDRTYDDKDINKIGELLKNGYNLTIKKYKQKSESLYPIFTIFLMFASYYFSKGFFSKLGDKLGEEVGEDIKKLYRKLKSTITEVVLKRKSSKTPLLKFELINENEPNISIYIRTNKKDVILEFLDNIENIYKQIKDHITKVITNNLISFVITFSSDGKSVEECYYISNKNEVFSMLK